MGITGVLPWRNRGFRLGLALRLLAVIFVVPHVQKIWFLPFLRQMLLSPSIDPWSNFLRAGGDPMSFPYGIWMLIYHAPFVALGLLGEWATGFHGLAQAGFALSLLVADTALLAALCLMRKEHVGQVVVFYWLSPIVFYICYWHGQTDIVPTFLILSSLLLIRSRRMAAAGGVYALALAAKLSAIVPLPFILIFLWKNRRNREGLLRFVVANVLASIVLQLPVLLSPGYRAMVLGSPEIARIYDLAIQFSANTNIYIVPVLYLLLLFWAWQIGRMNFQMLLAFLGVSYFLILLATPAAVGWFLWVVPFLVVFETDTGSGPRMVIAGFSVLFVLLKLQVVVGASIPALGIDLSLPLSAFLRWPGLPLLASLGTSALTAAGLVICIVMVQRALRENDFFRLSRRPLVLGIAGDSGSGKDTLSASLAGLFGDHSVASVSGDDYHRFERSSPMWQVVSHLDPRANDLNKFANDCFALLAGKHIQCRSYDHATGLFTRRQQRLANDVVLVSGLHALSMDNLRARMDLRIFLDMDEDLRRFLKIRRDTVIRGHSREHVLASIERRRIDFSRFIHPQIEHADVVFSLQATAPERLLDFSDDKPIALRLHIKLRTLIRTDHLVRVLTSLCGIQAEIVPASDKSSIELHVEGHEISAEDVQATAMLLVPHIEELLDVEPLWQSGMAGIMQVVALTLIAERAKNRN